ncbi:unnamed protein product [Periconia digitata]|uniref:Methyltransferase n=1 Tax=Periconia digitata TaxID=1303443 RepID=A0A9W4UG72_9PLEO|nr:unnamed protein product [Periconia digitata]
MVLAFNLPVSILTMSDSREKEQYIMESNLGEVQRLANQHETIKSAMDTLTVAPINFSGPSLRILDSGTADGLWLRDLRSVVGEKHEFVGTDIVEAFFPQPPSPGVSLHIQSITHEWPADQMKSFDYVHQRLTLAGAGQTPVKDCVARLAELVKPGGWVELVEAVFDRENSNGPALQRFETMMIQMLNMVGVGSAYARPLKTYLEQSGLANASGKVFDIPYGAACRDEKIAAKSTAHLVAAATGLRDFIQSQKVDLGMTGTELEKFPQAVKDEAESQGAHFGMLVVCAQRLH